VKKYKLSYFESKFITLPSGKQGDMTSESKEKETKYSKRV
jgi:hypothetical protein